MISVNNGYRVSFAIYPLCENGGIGRRAFDSRLWWPKDRAGLSPVSRTKGKARARGLSFYGHTKRQFNMSLYFDCFGKPIEFVWANIFYFNRYFDYIVLLMPFRRQSNLPTIL